jgi:hypothetical protein
MRRENLTAESRHDRAADAALFGADAVTTRTFDTCGRRPAPFEWTVNPYRGCTHACVHFAR